MLAFGNIYSASSVVNVDNSFRLKKKLVKSTTENSSDSKIECFDHSDTDKDWSQSETTESSEDGFEALVLWFSSTLPGCEPIMVSFGTSKGPIVPRGKEQPAERNVQPKTIVARSPAPVKENREDRDDTPNPNNYQPLVPQQYRDKLLAVKPSPNLILGTAVDQKYTPSLQKYNIYKKQLAKQDGVDYRGPHTFDNSIYYNNFQQKKTTLHPSVRYSKEELQRRGKAYYPNSYPNAKWVPQIGVIYSSGVRYYVPQVVYYNQDQNDQNGEDENSVYDKEDQKYYHYDIRQ